MKTIMDVLLMGVGAARLTRKKARIVAQALVRKGWVNNRQAQQLVQRAMKEGTRLRREGVKDVALMRKALAKVKKAAKGKMKAGARRVARRMVRMTR